jgi:hypothetical protein
VKTPSLRNVGLRERFMSSGQFKQMGLVLQHYQQRGLFQPLPGDVNAMGDFLMNGLTDPRVASRLPPFDRPTLWSERVPSASNLFGAARAGSGGIVPVLLGDSPPYLGSPEFKIGLGDALGGTRAALLISPRTVPPGTLFLGVPVSIEANVAAVQFLTVSPGGPGQGLATARMALPTDPTLLGRSFYAQWLVRDTGITPRISVTRAAEFEFFARP